MTRTLTDVIGDLDALAQDERLDGEWSQDVANLRCLQYARLVGELTDIIESGRST